MSSEEKKARHNKVNDMDVEKHEKDFEEMSLALDEFLAEWTNNPSFSKPSIVSALLNSAAFGFSAEGISHGMSVEQIYLDWTRMCAVAFTTKMTEVEKAILADQTLH